MEIIGVITRAKQASSKTNEDREKTDNSMQNLENDIANSTEKLPSDYKEVKYIQSTSTVHNTNYIDTGVYPTNNTTMELKLNGLNTDYDRWFGSSNLFRNELNGGNCYRTYINNVQFRCFIDVTIKQDKDKLYINNELKNTFSEETFADTNPLRLFSATIGDRDGKVKIYYCKIWENDVIIRDLIPCYRKSDNEPGMYDIVNNVFYQNQGTVPFQIGE